MLAVERFQASLHQRLNLLQFGIRRWLLFRYMQLPYSERTQTGNNATVTLTELKLFSLIAA